MAESSNCATPDHITLEEWKRGGHYYTYETHNIFYRTNNNANKPTLLLMHGFPTSSWDYTYLWKVLAERFNLFAIDMLGFGLSDKPFNHSYSTQEQADLISAILHRNGIKTFHVLAHDYGDTVTQEMIARCEERNKNIDFKILSACFLNGGLFPESHNHTSLQGLLAGRWGRFANHFITQKTAQRALSQLFGEKHKPTTMELDTLWQLISHNRGNQIFHKLLQYIKERKQFRERWVGALQNTSTPIRLINGPDDPVSGINMVENYREKITNPDIVLLEGAGHFPHLEVPQQVLDAYLDFHHRMTNLIT